MKVRCINTTKLQGSGVVPGLVLNKKYWVQKEQLSGVKKDAIFYDIGLRAKITGFVIWVPAVRFADEMEIPDYGMSKNALAKLNKKEIKYFATVNRFLSGELIKLSYAEQFLRDEVDKTDNLPTLLIHHKINFNAL